MKKLILLTVATLLVSTSGYANKRCGLGSKFFGKNKSIFSQFSEIITNVASSENYSISSGTSGCKHNGNLFTPSIGKADLKEEAIAEQRAFADVNFEELKMEMATGNGEILTGLAGTFGCNQKVSRAFFKMTHDGFHEIVSSPDVTPTDVVEKIREKIILNAELSANCWLS